MLDRINSTRPEHIVTIEDPIEFLHRDKMGFVNQREVEVDTANFSSALRAALRQDPDVILVGEIRDAETAKIAMQAAQTGHLVLSSLHTDDAPSVVTRLMDIGSEPYVIAGALVGVVAQRLVRRLCVNCRRQFTPPAETLRALNIGDTEAASIPFYKSVGCDQCSHTGYRGRIGIYEVMRVTDKLRRAISARASEAQIRDAAVASGMITLGEDGLAKVKSGVTTPEELLRVVTEVREVRTLCTGCGAAVGVDFVACPQCGKRQGGGCPHCGRSLQPGWNFCPYCAKSTETKRVGKRLRERELPAETRRELPPANVAEFKK
jgi:type IV pilus assembly protein PilB